MMSEVDDLQKPDIQSREIGGSAQEIGGSAQLETLIDTYGREWTVRLRRPDGRIYTLSRGFWWKPHSPDNKEWQKTVGIPMSAAQKRLLRLWKATRPVQ